MDAQTPFKIQLKFAAFAVLSLMLAACATPRAKPQKTAEKLKVSVSGALSEPTPPQPEKLVWKIDSDWRDPVLLRLEADFGAIQRADVEHWVHDFTVENRDRFMGYMERAERIRTIVEPILRKNGLPEELIYLAMIESGFIVHAQSPAKAVGVWQFIAETSRRYGLRVDRFVDERRDPIRATEAAAQYLRDLYNVFHSWPLALAAYNAGENRVLRAIMNGKSRDFWSLSEKRALPEETRDYVPKFMAAVWVARNLSKYGFQIKRRRLPAVEAVELPSSIRVRDIERLAQLNEKALANWNPHLIRGVVPASMRGTYPLWVPSVYVSKVVQARDRLERVVSSIR